MRVGANLVELPKAAATQDLHRGYSLTTNEIEPTTTLDVVVQRSPRLQPTSPAGRSLKNGSGVYVQYGTGRIPATVVFPNRNTLEVGESDIGQLRLASPVAAFVGDRFVIRDGAEQQTIAGGIILDTNSSPRSFRTAAQQRLLGTRASHPDNLHGYVESELIRRGPIHVQSLLPNSNFSAAEIANALDDLAKSGRVVRCGDIAADANSWQRIRQRAVDLIEGRHERMPQLDGVALTELRAALPELSSEVVEALVMQLCETGFVRHGSIVARASHRSTLPEPLEQSAKQILAALLEKPLDPPARTRLALDPNRQQAVRYLIEHGQIVDLGADLLLSGEAFTRAREAVVRFISANGSATVSQLREALQTSRRVAVPLLERLDRERVTRRVGDRRVLTNHKPSAE
jgi:selenocysteine-specific elongation factor